MAKFNVTLAGNVRAYACVTIEADNEDAAWQRAKDIAASDNIWGEPEIACGVTFDPSFDDIYDIEALEDCGLDEVEA
jgi:hypothetical protein